MYLGLDLGTSGLKALLCDEDQQVLSVARVNYPTYSPKAGWAEQDPADWIRAAEQAVAEIRSLVPDMSAKLRAIGLSGQMHSLVALDDRDQPLRPAMLWNDARGEAFLNYSGTALPLLASTTGVGAMTSFTAAKLDWLLREEPATFAAIRRILLPKDFLRLWLTGGWATDASDAAGTQLFDQASRTWSSDVLAALRIDPSLLPPVLEGTSPAGALRSDLAQALGPPVVPVICGGGDAATGALATACVDEGRALISLGTGAVYLTADRRYAPPINPSLHHFAHCLPDRWYRMAAILNCGSALDWACRFTAVGTAPEALEKLDARTWTGPSTVTVLPYLDGVRTPHGHPLTRAAVVGLDRVTDGLDLVQATMEGICFALADADAALRASGAVAEVPTVIGGGARSATWTRMLATILDRPLAVAEGAEGGSALGAVRLGLLGIGMPIADVALPPPAREVGPVLSLRGVCQDRLGAFRALYPSIAAYGAG